MGLRRDDETAERAAARLEALLCAFPEIGKVLFPGLIFLALLHEPGLDLVASEQQLSDGDKAALHQLIEDDVRSRLERMRDVTHHTIASWLEEYWLPAAPREELEVVRNWGPVFTESYPDRRDLPVTAVATHAAFALFSRRVGYDVGVDHECHIEMRRLATRALGTPRVPTFEHQETWELRTQGVGWHHGGQ